MLAAKRVGLTLQEIKDLLDRSKGGCVGLSAERRAAQIAHLEAQLSVIQAALTELRAASEE